MLKRRPVIHIGMPKTATKTFQWRLFAHHSEIFYLGRFDGSYFGKAYRRYDKCRDGDVQTIMKEIAYDNVYNPDIARCRSLLDKVLRPAIEQDLLPVWSWESYSTDILAKRRVRAKNLKRVFGDAKIIMTLRNPVQLLESAYFQQLQRDNVGARAVRGRPPYLPTIDKWLKSGWNGEVLPHIQYADTLQAYVDQFGRDNVHVLLFEDLKADSIAFYRAVCRIMEIDDEEGVRLMAEKSDNERWTVNQVEALAKIRSSPVRILRFCLADKPARKTMIGLQRNNVPLVAGEKAKAPIAEEWRRRIYQQTEKGNRWIEEMFGLDLGAHGYFEE